MQLEIGNIYEGKVCDITKFGAFVEIGDKTGMVHISEISNTFVNDIREHLTVGQQVKVKVVSFTDDGKISLSIKKALPKPTSSGRDFHNRGNNSNGEKRFNKNDSHTSGKNFNKNATTQKKPQQRRADSLQSGFGGMVNGPSDDKGFEEMLSRFKAASEEKFSGLKNMQDVKRTRPRRK